MDKTGRPPVPEKYLYDYNGTCWWCGAPADSREHKWKRSEVADLFGSGSYDSIIWMTDGLDEPARIEKIRGPGAARLKFSNTLCNKCNSTRSQPFDNAYSIFSKYLLKNYSKIMQQHYFDLSEIYGLETESQRNNLARYYAKHIGCRIAEKAGRVPENLIDFLNERETIAPCVYSEFGIHPSLIDRGDHNVLSLRDSVSDYSENPSIAGLTSFKSGIGVGAIEFIYDVNLNPARPNTGNGIIEDNHQDLWPHPKGLYDYRIHPRPRRTRGGFSKRLLGGLLRAGRFPSSHEHLR